MARLGWKSNGFTPKKQAIYLEALADGASRAEAAAAAQVSPTTPANYEKKDEAFASLCRAARARAGGVSMGTRAWERGVTGVEEEIVRGGKVVGRRLRRSDAIFKMILEGDDSGLYGPAVRALREKIEKELRPRIESDIRAQISREMNPREVRKRLDAKLSDFNRRMGGDG
ncbi:MAG TPA: hypothetical protein VEA61_04145 [Allosphingosinicella sp.]|nr:hypothetical protein [Allosphingosinicella sp.]